MCKIINKITNETICEVNTNHSMTIEEMLEIAGAERITEDHPAYDYNECGDYYLDGKEIWVEELEVIPSAYERVKYLRRQTGLSQQKFADRFGIPMRTLQNWEYGINEAPDYLLDLLEQAIKAEKESRKPDLCKLTIHYKNGNTLEQLVWYAHIEQNMLTYTRYQNPAPAFQEPTIITLEHIESFDIESLPKSETVI